MYLVKKLRNGCRVDIIVRHTTKGRLGTTCFRGIQYARAGNFALWNSVEELFADNEVLGEFLAELLHLSQQQEFGTHSVCIPHSEYVGWESTAPITQYRNVDLERFQLNRKGYCLRVSPTRTDLHAPLTQYVTIVFEFKAERKAQVAVVHSIYPGEDVGNLQGDVTARERRIFFDFGHPGAIKT